jgi:ABC-type transporter Mla MlaB component
MRLHAGFQYSGEMDVDVHLGRARKRTMFRVSTTKEGPQTTVTLDGQLSSESIGAVEACCEQARAAGAQVRLFLRDVSAIDRAGRELLAKLAGRGVQLAADGVYNSYLVGEYGNVSARQRGDVSIRPAR